MQLCAQTCVRSQWHQMVGTALINDYCMSQVNADKEGNGFPLTVSVHRSKRVLFLQGKEITASSTRQACGQSDNTRELTRRQFDLHARNFVSETIGLHITSHRIDLIPRLPSLQIFSTWQRRVSTLSSTVVSTASTLMAKDAALTSLT